MQLCNLNSDLYSREIALKHESLEGIAQSEWEQFEDKLLPLLREVLAEWQRMSLDDIGQYDGESAGLYFLHMKWDRLIKDCIQYGYTFMDDANPIVINDPNWLRLQYFDFLANYVDKHWED